MGVQIKVLVDGGKANAGPLGPSLGPTGVNIGQVVAEINQKTKEFAGMKVPVTIDIDKATKSFEIKVGKPPTSALILKEINQQKGSQGNETIGNLTMDQVKKIAEIKMDQMNTGDLNMAIRQVIGTCKSMGVTVDGKDPKEVLAK